MRMMMSFKVSHSLRGFAVSRIAMLSGLRRLVASPFSGFTV